MAFKLGISSAERPFCFVAVVICVFSATLRPQTSGDIDASLFSSSAPPVSLCGQQARALIARYRLKQQPEEIVKEMLAHTLPEVLVVASMVAAIALLQTDGHYSYITV